MIKFITISVSIITLIYIIGCFCFATFNMKLWSEEGRGALGSAGLLIILIANFGAFLSDDKNKPQ